MCLLHEIPCFAAGLQQSQVVVLQQASPGDPFPEPLCIVGPMHRWPNRLILVHGGISCWGVARPLPRDELALVLTRGTLGGIAGYATANVSTSDFLARLGPRPQSPYQVRRPHRSSRPRRLRGGGKCRGGLAGQKRCCHAQPNTLGRWGDARGGVGEGRTIQGGVVRHHS